MLTPARLSAEEALDLYPYRWGIERMFFDLKEVLNLNRVYAANPNAVAMQVYAAAIVYNGMRVAQSEATAQLGWPPRGYLARQVLPQARGRLSSASPGTAVGTPVPPPPRGSRPSAAHPPAPALGPHGEHHHRCRTALRVPPSPALLPGAASLEVTGPCPRRSPLPGEVILAAMRFNHALGQATTTLGRGCRAGPPSGRARPGSRRPAFP